MDCKKIEEIILTDYMDGRLDSRELKAVEAHLASCGRCRELASEAAGIGKELRLAEELTPSPAVWQRIRAAISGEPARAMPAQNFFQSLRLSFARLRPAIVVASAVAVILAVLITARLMPPGGSLGQEEIMSLVSIEENGAGYDLGTPVESYFL